MKRAVNTVVKEFVAAMKVVVVTENSMLKVEIVLALLQSVKYHTKLVNLRISPINE